MPKKSNLWSQHFTLLTDEDGKSLHKATCNHCRDGKVHETKSGTTNLWRHLKRSHPQEVAAAAEEEGAAEQQQPPPPCPPSGISVASVDREARLEQDEAMQDMEEAANAKGCGGQESADAGTSEQPPQPLPSLVQVDEAMQMQQLPLLPPGPGHSGSGSAGAGTSEQPSLAQDDEACKHLARLIALRGYDASILEDDCFRSFVRSLNPEFEVPSRVAIEEMCDGIFHEARRDLFSRLLNAPARASVAVGMAKIIEAGEVIYTACHFIDDEWNLRKLVLDAAIVDEEQIIDSVHDAMLGVRLVAPSLYNYADDVLGTVNGHGIQDRLSMVAYDDSFINPDLKNIEDKIICHTYTNLFVDNELHEIAGCLLPCSFASDQLDAIEDLTRKTRQQLLSHCGLDDPWTYNKSWYSNYCSIKVTLHKGGYSSEDVNIASLLCKVWGTIHQAIQRISASTSNICLRELFNVREVLQSGLAKASDDCAEYHILVEARDTLDEAIQDSYQIWSVPFVLDPRYNRKRLKFCFERLFGSEEAAKYVSEVMTRANELYDYYYKKKYGGVTGMMATTSADPFEQAWNEHLRQQDVIMVDQVNCTYPETQTELHRYLEDPPVPSTQDFDILDWWKVHSSRYPTVALMARDALAWPTCSKLSSDQIAQVRSMIRGYSKETYAKKFL